MKFTVTSAVDILSRTPSTLDVMLQGLSTDWLGDTGDRDNWGPFDVVGHLINTDKTNFIPRLELIFSENKEPVFPPFDRFAHFKDSKGKTLKDRLTEFAEVRKASLDKVADWQITADQLDRTAIHPDFGEVTLAQLLSTWTVHDLTHIRQIVNYLARRYAEEVGPWRQYLSILN